MRRSLHTPGGAAAPLSKREQRARRRELVLMVLTALVFASFAIVETRAPLLTGGGALVGNVVFFLLINLNLILLILMVFLVARNLVRLLFERRRGILGARLRTRLVLAFVALSLFPTTLLFVVAQGFLGKAFDTWFNVRVENALEAALEIAETSYQQAGDQVVHFGREIGAEIERRKLLRPEARRELERFLAAKRDEYGLAGVRVQAGDTVRADALGDGAGAMPDPSRAWLDRVVSAGTGAQTLQRDGPDVVRGGVRVGAPGAAAVVVVEQSLGRSTSRRAREIAAAHASFRQLDALRQPIKNGYVLSLSLITLVVVFGATWFGFRLAKGITVPIQRLAEGTREVAHGNWDHRIEAEGDDEIGTLVTSFNQMTADLQKTNSELEERRRYIETVLANIGAGVVSISRSGSVTTVNRAAEEMLGLRAAEAGGRSWDEVFARTDLREVGDMIASVAAGQQDAAEKHFKLSAGQRVLSVRGCAAVLRDDAGTRLGTVVFFEDVTQMLRVQRMEAWREVARRIAHEIKNPLTPIQLSAQRLRKRYGPELQRNNGAIFDECTRTIIRQVDELKRLVNEFSAFARLPPADMAPHDLNGVIDEALVLFREGHRDIGFVFTPAADLPVLEIDREAIKRAVINLVDNAVAACKSAGGEEPPRIEVATVHDGRLGLVRLEVSDNGSGVLPAVRGRLFEPYVSTKKDGTGLGLAIVSAIAADHQAYVRVRERSPRGSCFSIEFPLRGRETPLHAGHA